MAFIDQAEFEAMKTLSGWEAVRCDEYQFHAKIKVSAWTVYELSLFEQQIVVTYKSLTNQWAITPMHCWQSVISQLESYYTPWTVA